MSAPELNRRQVLAFIALTDAAPPWEVRFGEGRRRLSLSFDTHEQLRAWNDILGGEPVSDTHNLSTDGKKSLLSHGLTWRGYQVLLWSSQPAVDEPIEEPTASVLRELVDDADEAEAAAEAGDESRFLYEHGVLAGDVPGEVYERDEPEAELRVPSTVDGWPVGGRR